LPGVNIIVAGTATGTQSDFNGNYSIEAAIGEALVYSYIGFSTLESDVLGTGNVNIRMQPNSQLDEVVIVAQGMKREKKALGFGVSEVTAKDIEGRSESDVARTLSGKASGVAVTNQSGMSGSSTNVIIRGYNSITGSNQALIIVDGVPFSNDTNTRGSFITGNNGGSRLADLDPNLIHDVKVLKGLAATTLYGSAGRNGVILITTKSQATGPVNTGGSSSNTANADENVAPRILELRAAKTYAQKSTKPDYVIAIASQSSVDDMYKMYLQLRPENLGNPTFFIEVFDVMYKKNSKMATRILSNLGELDLDNYEMLKALGYKYEQIKNYKAASFVYKKVLELRPEDSQSYRDLALVYAKLGKTQEVDKLMASFKDKSFYTGNKRRRFEGFHQVLNTELLGSLNTNKNTTAGYDLRVVIDWNHNDTDIDLHIIDPNNEECYYSQPNTSMGGKMSSDMTQGFGPEQFVLANAKRGVYYVSLDYFADRYQKMDRPTYLKVTIFKNYGRPNQTQEVQVIHLDSRADEALLAKIRI
jgi:TonB-dependent SusC/RagA subfamily outer membrane receptor